LFFKTNFKEKPKCMINFELNQSQQDFIKCQDDFSRALAPAGSGKTATLLWKCLEDAKASELKNKYLIFTFTRVARDELRDRLNTREEFKELRKITRIETLNQWGFNYIKNLKDGLQLKTSKQDNFYLVNNNLRPLWEDNPILSKLSKNRYQYSEIIQIFGELKTLGFRHDHHNKDFLYHFSLHLVWLESNNLLKYFNEKVYNPLMELDLLDSGKSDTETQIKPFLEFWKNSTENLWKQSLITLEDQKYWALVKLCEQYSDGKIFPAPQRYQQIMIDEFQDINPLDLLLIKKLVELNKSKLTIVGDDDQAIFEWRASSPNFILQPEEYFRENFSTHILDINYRSPKNIVELSQRLIKNNLRRIDKKITPILQNHASIQLLTFGNHMDSVQYIIEQINRSQDQKKTERIAIISRKKGQLIPIQITLTSNDIEYYAKEDLNILLSHAFNDLKKLLEIVPEKNSRRSSDSIVNDLISFCNKVYKYPLNKKDNVALRSFLQKRAPKTFQQGLDILLEYPFTIKGKHILSFQYPILNVVNCETVSDAILTIEQELSGLKKHYAKSDDDIFYKDPPFLYMVEYAEKYDDDFWGFIDHMEKAIEKMTSFDEFNDNVDLGIRANVHLMTALRAKGKEFDTVIVLDVNDGIWPIRYAEDEYELEQERRLFYVVTTRAKKRLIFLSLKEMLGNPLDVCPYFQEMGLSISDFQDNTT